MRNLAALLVLIAGLVGGTACSDGGAGRGEDVPSEGGGPAGVGLIDVDAVSPDTARLGDTGPDIPGLPWDGQDLVPADVDVCPPGFGRTPAGCVDRDECAGAENDCEPGETCVNVPGAYRCVAKSYVEPFDDDSGLAETTNARVAGGGISSTFVPRSPVVPDADLLVHLPLDVTLDDVSGNGNDGQMENGPHYVGAGRVGSALRLRADETLTLSPSASLDELAETGAFSLATWVRPHGDDGACLVTDGRSWEETAFRLCRGEAGDSVLIFYLRGPGEELITVTSVAPDTIEIGEWSHVAVTYVVSTGTTTLYLDGERVAHIDSASGWRTDATIAGAALALPEGLILRGGSEGVDLDDFALWRRALPPNDIASLASAPGTIAEARSVWIDAGTQMYSLLATWPTTPALDDALSVAINTGGDWWCDVENGVPYDPFSPCRLSDGFAFRLSFAPHVERPRLDELRFAWELENNGSPSILDHHHGPLDGSRSVWRVSFRTNERAFTILRFQGRELPYGPGTLFAIDLQELDADTEYDYELTVSDAFGEATTASYSFRTAP